ncbi:UDP-N-acetylmuramoyl-tripeptide--D-alanyl-D-alanine ligase [Aureisphaera galaxeae]|uniref:UDP-N-acetylmuramoyl-tripeptide--D-alanyl-D- alanine ligase n=1 Tax=Aureisphaera galaxeae TaxID=1538023 RepID=UPI002350D4DC|nr:UDP-N-acetylmuramoyl-tripeptide--D-alanyl-D-alanine ligase [Aureisphaera galaxeae]MDC8005644.1 UDP-N-acetylmuramoyl-tripeptide--D-alanyl-D-alanine ligase [Aureisphaera galaxeae]
MKIEQLHQHFLESSGICTDTRKITPNCLFFALKGDNFDGNTFAQEALDKGALKVVIDDMRHHKNTGETILCGNVLHTLQKLASFHRNQLGIPIVALTGSNGKTTTKELINAVLSKKFRTTATLGNLNNHIGVPLTLLSMNKETEMGIVEMGANHLKEIETLSKIAQPNYGYITNFGKAHLEGFGSLEGVVRGKSELYKNISERDKMVFVNGNDPKQMELTASMNRNTFGKDGTDCPVQLLESSGTLVIGYKGLQIKSNLIGIYNFHNIAAAIAMGSYFEVTPEAIKEAIEGYIPTMNRSQLMEKNGHHIILDAYNANPTSMMAALENFEQSEGSSKLMILGDMFELGDVAHEEHQKIANFVADHSFGTAYLVGENFFGIRSNSDNITAFKNFEDFKSSEVLKNLPASSILIKGSRGMALERVLELL